MLAARLDLVLTGPGLAVHVHGESPRLFADIRLRRSAFTQLSSVIYTLRSVRALSATLRRQHVRVDLRIAGRSVGRLG